MGANYESQILGFLEGTEHLTPEQAAGVLGNAEVESGFDPTRLNAKEGAIGFFQWEGGRRTALQEYAATHGGKETDASMQLGYLATELAGPYAGVLAQLRTTSTPAEAAAIWDVGPGGTGSGTGFENSTGEATATRQTDAQSIYEQIQTGKLTGGFNIGAPLAPPGLASQIVTGGIDAAGAAKGAAAAGETIFGGVVGNLLGAGDFSWVVRVVVKGMFTLGGIGLVVLGTYAAARPAGATA